MSSYWILLLAEAVGRCAGIWPLLVIRIPLPADTCLPGVNP
jgi:hypothetical protein